MNKSSLIKALKSAVWIALPGAIISLLFCMLILGSGVFQMLLPVWLGIIFTVISFALERIPVTANHLWMKIVISATVITITAICLHFFLK